MGLETANYIPELDESNPAGLDPKSQGDDHIRTTKAAVKGSFPAFVGTTATPKAVTLTEDEISDAAQRSVPNTFTDLNTFDGQTNLNNTPLLANNVSLRGRDIGGTQQLLLSINTADQVLVGTGLLETYVRGSIVYSQIGSTNVAYATTREDGSFFVYDRTGDDKKAGFRNPTLSTVAASRAVTQDDEGRVLDITGAAVTLTMDALSAYTTMRVRAGANGVTLNPGTAALTWLDGSGTAKTGTRTVVAGSVVEVYYTASGACDIFGNGIS